MKIAIVYYSYEGTTAKVSSWLASYLNDVTLFRLEVKDEMNKKGLGKYLWGGKNVVTKEKPELKKIEFDPSIYDVILIGTPVWAFSFTPALRSFFDQYTIENKKVGLYCTCDGGPGRTIDKMKNELRGNSFIFGKVFGAPLRDEEKTKKELESLAMSIDK